MSDGQHFVFGQKVHEKWMYYDGMDPFNAGKDVDYVEKQPADRFSVTWMIFSWDCFFSLTNNNFDELSQYLIDLNDFLLMQLYLTRKKNL